MKKYPLEQLVFIKKKKLEEAEKVLQQQKALLEQEEKKLVSLEKERDKVKTHKIAKLEQLRAELDRGSTSDKIQQMKSYLKIVDENLKQHENKVQAQLKQVSAAFNQVELARKDFLKKRQDVEKMHLHRQEWDKEQGIELERHEASVTDEVGTMIHHRSQRRKKHD